MFKKLINSTEKKDIPKMLATIFILVFSVSTVFLFTTPIGEFLVQNTNPSKLNIQLNNQEYDVSETIGEALYLIANKNIIQSEMLEEIEIKMDELAKDNVLTSSEVNVFTGKIMDSKAQNYGMVFVITEKDKTYNPYGFYVTGYFESPYLSEYESIIITFNSDEIVIVKGVKSNSVYEIASVR